MCVREYSEFREFLENLGNLGSKGNLRSLVRLGNHCLEISTGSKNATREYVGWCGSDREFSEIREFWEYRELREQ